MANMFQRVFSRKGSVRMDQNDWAAQWMTFQGNAYPLGVASLSSSEDRERIANDFQGYVQGAYKSSGIVYAVMVARMMIFTEARFQYQRLNKGRPGDLFGMPSLHLLENPWPNGQTADLLAKAMQDTDLGGNHYVVTEFDKKTKKNRLRHLRPDWVEIILTKPPNEAVDSDIAGYLYKPGGTENKALWKLYPIDGSQGTVAHWAPIPDPEAQYRGMSWMTPVLTEIMSDKAMVKHKQKFFENAATPAISVSLKETVTEEQFKNFMDTINRSTRGVDNAYKTLYLGGGADVKVIGTTLQQMDFTKTAGHGETRICAAARINPVLVGVAENMHGATLNQGNFTAAKNMFADATMRPLWRSLAQAYSVLVPELSNARLWYDDRDIPFLRQDQVEVANLKSTEATTINGLIAAGFTPKSVILAVKMNDWDLLEHTGYFSVQLQPPGSSLAVPPGAPGAPPAAGTTPPKGDAETPAKEDDGPEPPATPTDEPE